MSDSSLITLPFDGTQDDPRPVTASQRRMLYRDLWSDMILERLQFVQTGEADFTVSGALIVGGAYARFNAHPIAVAGQMMDAQMIVARIGFANDKQNVEFFFAPQGNPEGGLVVATLSPQGASWNPSGLSPSPIRIPDRTIAGVKLGTGTVTRNEIAANTIDQARIATAGVNNRIIADAAVTNAKIANSAVNNDKIANGTIAGNKLRREGWTDWRWTSASGWVSQGGGHRFVRHGGIVHFEATIRPTQSAHQTSTGNSADYTVGTVSTLAARPWSTVHLTDPNTGSVFAYSADGTMVRRSSGWAQWGTGFRVVRGVFIAGHPA
jgi:hypothetical protein